MYTFLSQEATAKRKESGCGENLRADMASAGGSGTTDWSVQEVSSERGTYIDILTRHVDAVA